MSRVAGCFAAFLSVAVAPPAPSPSPAPSGAGVVLAEIDRRVRAEFWDPKLKGAAWGAAVEHASRDLPNAATDAERDAVFDRLLAVLDDSHTFRVPAGRLPEKDWATAGLRIGRSGDGCAVKGVLPGGSAERAGLKVGDAVVSVGGRPCGGPQRMTFRDLFLSLEGQPRGSVEVIWRAPGAASRTAQLPLEPEPAGDALVWKSARVIRRGGRAWGYLRIWGMSAETALAVVDLLSDRVEAARASSALAGFDAIEGLLLDVRGNSGGYEPDILTTFLRGRWSAGDYWVRSRDGRRLVPPEYRPLPVALLVNSGTASAGEALAVKFRRHAIGPVVGEETAGMLSGGASFARLSDGSGLWLTARAVEDEAGRPWEGRPVRPDVVIEDRPGEKPGDEDRIVEGAIRELARRSAAAGR
ncbi:MAG TPA: S41 family peptidase [Thermoanaerobaculia bacterium]|nr:S41 family peptidase [Thermoanaerobaculia bacterium]